MVRCCLTFYRLRGFWSTFIFFLQFFFFSHFIDILLISPAVLQYMHSSPTWPRQRCSLRSPSLLVSFLGIHQFSCSFPRGPMGHSYTHTRRHMEPISAALFKRGPLDPSAISASYRWERWQFGEVVKCHTDTWREESKWGRQRVAVVCRLESVQILLYCSMCYCTRNKLADGL